MIHPVNAPLGFIGLGFVGLGDIGKPMALRLADWPGGLRVHDLEPARVDELVSAGAKEARSVADLAELVDLVCVTVRDDEQVREVVAQALGSARPGTTIAVHSTVSPELPAELAAEAARHGVDLVDAPVSGGAVGAADGSLAILVGGTPEAYAACHEPFMQMGAQVVHCGPVGAGTAAKLARNLLHFVSFAAAGEAAHLAEAAGLSLLDLGRVVRHTDAVTGGAGAIMHRDTTKPIAPDDGWFAVLDHLRALGEKDLDHAIALAERLGVDVPLARLARSDLAAALGLEAR